MSKPPVDISAFETLIDNIPDIVVRVDLDGRYLYVNRAAERNPFGMPRSAFIGKTPAEMGTDPEIARRVREGELRVIETGEPYRFESTGLGSQAGRTFDIFTVPERDETGRVTSVLRILRDVTTMKESETRWRLIAEAVPQLVWMCDPDGRATYFNQRWYDYTGLTEERSIGTAWAGAVHSDDRERVLAKWQSSVASGSEYEIQYRIRAAGGDYLWFLGRGVPIRNEAGAATAWFGTCTDIHEQMQREHELKDSRARLALALDAADMAVFTSDLDLRYTWVRNPRGGFGKEQIIGRTDYDLVSDRELVEPLTAMKREVLRTGQRMNEHFRLTHPPDARELWWDITVEPVRNDSGEITGLLGTARDISAMKRAEIAVRESEERFRLAARASQAMVYDWNMITNETYRSDAVRELTGYSPEETRASQWWLADIHPDDLQPASARVASAIANGGDRYENEYRVRHRDGSWRYLWDRGFIVRDKEGRAIRAVGSTIDMTARRQAEEEQKAARAEAERANRVKDEFLTSLSHELRTPMTSILGWTSMLVHGMVEQETMPMALATIHDSAEAQAQLIEDLLDISRITTRKLYIDIRPIDLVSIIASSVESFRVSAASRKIDLRIAIGRSNVLIAGDEKRARQIVTNLIGNALKFTPAGGRVEVALEQNDDTAAVIVRDTGIGISPDFLPHVFDRFSQQDASESRAHGGLGIGLAIVSELATLHGGSVKAESDGPGQGATFTVTFPRVASPLPASAAPVQRPAPRLDGVRVLLVEDEPHTRHYMESLLESSGAVVRSAASVAEALDLEIGESVLVSDIAMPGEDGLSLIAKLRTRDARAGRRRTPALAVTALGFADDRKRILSAGFDEYLAKPVDAIVLLETIASMIWRSSH